MRRELVMKEKLRYGTHREALAAAVARSQGPMLEVGAGAYSTPLLLEVVRATRRQLVTVERNSEWAAPYIRRAKQLGVHRRYHSTPDLLTGLEAFPHFGVALVDGAADERAKAVTALLPKCDFIVVHDTERLMDYPGLAEILQTVRFRKDFMEQEPWTSIVSDLVRW
jgi:protein-L-isoaspartate O-methyltransferase